MQRNTPCNSTIRKSCFAFITVRKFRTNVTIPPAPRRPPQTSERSTFTLSANTGRSYPRFFERDACKKKGRAHVFTANHETRKD